MRLFAAAVALFLFLVAPALAAGPVFDTPKALLQYAYQPYSTGDFKDDNDVLYTKQLNDMFAAADAATPDDEVGPIDFDVFVNGQDYQLTDLTIGDPVPDGAGQGRWRLEDQRHRVADPVEYLATDHHADAGPGEQQYRGRPEQLARNSAASVGSHSGRDSAAIASRFHQGGAVVTLDLWKVVARA